MSSQGSRSVGGRGSSDGRSTQDVSAAAPPSSGVDASLDCGESGQPQSSNKPVSANLRSMVIPPPAQYFTQTSSPAPSEVSAVTPCVLVMRAAVFGLAL